MSDNLKNLECGERFESFASTGGHFQFDARRAAEISPTLPPDKAEELSKKLHKKKKPLFERRDLGSRAPRVAYGVWMPANFDPNAHNTVTPFSDNGNTAGMMPPPPPPSLSFETPPPVVNESPTNQHVFAPIPSLDETTSSALQADALMEAATQSSPSMTLSQLKTENDVTEQAAQCLAKRKLVFEQMHKLNDDLMRDWKQYKKICATIHAEVPVVHNATLAALESVQPLIARYDSMINSIISKKQTLDFLEAPVSALLDFTPSRRTDCAFVNFCGFSQCVCSLIVSYAPRALPHTYAPCRAVGRDPQGSRGDAPT